MKNSAGRGGCYPQASVDETLRDLQPFRSLLNNTTSSPGFLGHLFNNLQRAAL